MIVIRMNGAGVSKEQRTVAIARSHMMLVIGRLRAGCGWISMS